MNGGITSHDKRAIEHDKMDDIYFTCAHRNRVDVLLIRTYPSIRARISAC